MKSEDKYWIAANVYFAVGMGCENRYGGFLLAAGLICLLVWGLLAFSKNSKEA